MTPKEHDLKENGIYILEKGKLTKITPIAFGQVEIVYQNGCVHDIKRNETIRYRGQDMIK